MVGVVCLGAVFYLDRPLARVAVGVLGVSALWFGISIARGGHRTGSET
jgi:hypothetical protein